MKESILAAALTIGALVIGPTAQAGDIDLGVVIGIPGIVLGGPIYYPPPPPSVVLVPQPVYGYGPGAPYYYDKHAEKRWKKHQEKRWEEYRRAYYGGYDQGDDDD